MPKFKVTIRQWVEEVDTLLVEAKNADFAQSIALSRAEEGDVNWSEGSDVKDIQVTGVRQL